MPAALLAGAFGQQNLGDDALLEAFVRGLPDWDLTVTTADPEAAVRLGCKPVAAREPRAVAATPAGRADAVVVGGGTVLKTLHGSADRRPHALLVNAALLTAASSARHRPVAMVGVGAGHLTDRRARALARFVVGHADLLVLRDEESAGELIAAGVPRAPSASAPTRRGPSSTRPTAHRARAGPASGWCRPTSPRPPTGGPGWSTASPRRAGGCWPPVWTWRSSRGSRARATRTATTVPSPTPSRVASVRRSRCWSGPLRWVRPWRRCQGRVPCSRSASTPSWPPAPPGCPPSASPTRPSSGPSSGDSRSGAPPSTSPRPTWWRPSARRWAPPDPPPSVVKDQIAMAEDGFSLLRVLLDQGRSDASDSLSALPLSPSPSPGTPSRPSGR